MTGLRVIVYSKNYNIIQFSQGPPSLLTMAVCSTQSSDSQLRRHAGGYLPIENYGLIGNMRTCALVGMDGSVDFMCW